MSGTRIDRLPRATRRRRLAGGLLPLVALALGLASSGSAAQYPTRPIEIVVPIAPGGGMDLQARLLAELVEPILGQRVGVLNRPGAGGTLGMGLLTQAKPDPIRRTTVSPWSSSPRRRS